MQQIAVTEQHPSSMVTLKRLLGYVKDRRGGLALAILGMAGYGVVDTSLVYSIQPLIDDGLSGKNPSVLFIMAFVVMGLVFARGISAFLSDYFMSWVGSHVVMKLQREVFSHMIGMPMSFFDKHNTGNLLSKVTYDASQVSSAASSTLVALIREGVTVVGLLGMMFYHSWQLSLIFFLVWITLGWFSVHSEILPSGCSEKLVMPSRSSVAMLMVAFQSLFAGVKRSAFSTRFSLAVSWVAVIRNTATGFLSRSER